MPISYEDAKRVTDKTGELEELYPIEAAYNSRCSLWSQALSDAKVDRGTYDLARVYYGRLWHYVGN